MHCGKKILSLILATAFLFSLVACGGDHVATPEETGNYTVNYHDSVTLSSIDSKVEFSDFSVEDLADNGTGNLSFYITLHLPSEVNPTVYAAWFSNFKIGDNETNCELVTMGADGTGRYVQISEDSDELSDAITYHVFCSAKVSETVYSMTCSIKEDLNFEFVISASDVSMILFEQAEELFADEQYDDSLAYYELITGTQKEQADIRIQSIECLNAIDSLNATIEGNYNTTTDFLGQYMDALFNTSVSAEGSYDIATYTYNLRIYFSSMFSDIAGILGASLGEVVGNSGGVQGTHAKESYETFREAGFDSITCCVEYCDYEGNVIESDTYTKDDYERDHEPQIQPELAPEQNDDQITSTFVPGTVSEVPEGQTTAWIAGEYCGRTVKETIIDWDGELNYSYIPIIVTGESPDADWGYGFAEGYGSTNYTVLNASDTSADFDLYIGSTNICTYIFLENPGNNKTYYDMLHAVLKSMENTGSQLNHMLFEINSKEMLSISLHELEAIGRDQFTSEDAASGLGYF